MAHPYSHEAKSTSRTKFGSITGKSGKGRTYDSEPSSGTKYHSDTSEMKGDTHVSGKASGGRLDGYARGGKVGHVKGKKSITNIHINNLPQGGPPHAMGDPAAGGGLPPVGPPGGGPPMPPPGAMAGGPPMMRKRGGRLPTAGADSGPGRLQKVSLQKGKRG